MPRNLAHVSLFHLEPTQLADFLIVDCFRRAIAHSRYDEGLLVQIARGPTFRYAAGRLETIVALLPEASTHIWFHPDGAVLDLPIYDRSAVLAEYRNPSKPENIDDSEFAKAGWQEFIDEHPNFDDSPIFLERTADRQTTILENRLKDLRVDWSLAETLEDVYYLACSVEWLKLQGAKNWNRCDIAVSKLAETLDRLVDAFGAQYEPKFVRIENVLLSSLSRVRRCMRVPGRRRS